MGTAASVPGQEGFHEFPDDHPQGPRSKRSGNQSSRTVNSRSVRAMALMNHSRQENSYIHADSISSHLIARGSRRIDNDEIEFPKQFTEKGEGSIVPKNTRYHFQRRHSHEPTLATVPSISNIPVEHSKPEVEPNSQVKQLSGGTIASSSPPASPKSQPAEEKPPAEPAPQLKSLSLFRSNMNLKLDLGCDADPEPEWPVVPQENVSIENFPLPLMSQL